jgi:general secretion pathway protein E
MLACRVACLRHEDGTTILLADESSDIDGIAAAAAAQGLKLRFEHVAADTLDHALETTRAQALEDSATKAAARVLHEPVHDYADDVRQYYVEAIVARAVAAGASDIHIQPGPESLELRLRVDGALRTIDKLPVAAAPALVSQIKVLARLPLAQKRLPHDGRLRLSAMGREVDLRVSILPSTHGEAAVLRLGEQDAPRRLAQLGMSPALFARIRPLLGRRGGLVVVCGPTGSGKTTTLYAMMREMVEDGRKLLSVEDPVEQVVEGVNQVPVSPGGMGFDDSIRSMLRHSPDAMLIGEIRDAPTAKAAAEAALTGHLVLASIHARDGAEAALRLVDLGVSRHVVSCVLEAALSQRLVRLLCPACSHPVTIQAPILKALGAASGEGLLAPTGCPACGGTGWKGRRAVFGLLEASEEVRSAIAKGAGVRALRSVAMAQSMPTMLDAARELAESGLTSAQEALASIPSEEQA